MHTRNRAFKILLSILLASLVFGCSKRTLSPQVNNDEKILTKNGGDEKITDFSELDYLALGDSYTVGASVSPTASFPSQLTRTIEKELDIDVNLQILATSGWRTDDLLNALNDTSTGEPYGLVTLLIGVNNQYQGVPFSTYEIEFTELFNRAIALAGGNTNRLVVISIPDWAYTPFGQGFNTSQISKEIDIYNNFAQDVAEQNEVKFINITDITRRGLEQPELVASDGLHPSALAYQMFVDHMAPIIVSQLKN